MEQVVVKSEDTNSGDILLFFVDENGDHEEGVLTTVDSSSFSLQGNCSYVIKENNIEESSLDKLSNPNEHTDRWTDEEIQKLLTFYNDNKQIFVTGATNRKHLWAMACKTVLLNKTPLSCDIKLRNTKAKYVDSCKNRKGGDNYDPLFELCEKAFSDDPYVKAAEADNSQALIKFPITNQQNTGVFLKKYNTTKVDEKVDMMLRLYLKYKNNFRKQYFTRNLWETIAVEMGEEDGQYWQKRFLNFKQHYICLLEKRKDGCADINWPYMALYDEIFKDDEEFRRKYSISSITPTSEIPVTKPIEYEWLETEKITLLKYNYDCFEDFEDPNIPNSFLWTEIGRLLDRSPDVCRTKCNELKDAHYEKYFQGEYDLRKRKPLDILCDSIIAKGVELQMPKSDSGEDFEIWKTEEIDEIVKFLYDNIEMFKDHVCYYVCWGIVARKLKRSVASCRRQWEELVKLYKSILDDKKENPYMQIDWRYIELFDRIFDYGMDTNLLNGYERLKNNNGPDKIGVKKVSIAMDKSKFENGMDDDDSYDEMTAPKRSRRSSGDSKAFKILEYYQKNKDKFSTTNRNKHNLWASLSRQIGISEAQCAHRFRNLKQVYTAYVQREISRPEMPIVWPYYTLCKKVFGYRALKNKLKNSKHDADYEEWSASDIKQLVKYFAGNFDYISNNIEDVSKWTPVASIIDKTEVSCKEKFLELRKSYRKLKTQITRNPNVKISWKYFNMFEKIYNERGNRLQQTYAEEDNGLQDYKVNMEVDEQQHYSDDQGQEDEDFQCIIVIPEGADISDIDSSQIIIKQNSNLTTESNEINPKSKKWTIRSKKRLLINYINYVKSHKGKEIISKDMWIEIAEKLNKTALSCKKMFVKLKKTYKETVNDVNKTDKPYNALLEKVLKLKPKFFKPDLNNTLQEEEVFKNVDLPIDKVKKALEYYLQHIEDFVNPKFEKKFLWTELANYVDEPVTKIFNKVNYLKQAYESEQLEKDNEQIVDLLKEIIAKEIAINLVTDIETASLQNYLDRDWVDEETEQLLEWYLGNLDKFKNPKFVRSYLWREISNMLNRSPLDCSKKMSEVRSQYRDMVRENSDVLETWRFFALCQKIYGTGKKGNVDKVE